MRSYVLIINSPRNRGKVIVGERILGYNFHKFKSSNESLKSIIWKVFLLLDKEEKV
jgi:hypothetical protein